MTTTKGSDIVAQDFAAAAKALAEVARELEGKTMVISGGAGFLGKYFTALLQRLNRDHLAEPCRVIVVDNYITGTRNAVEPLTDPNMEFLQQDVREPLHIPGPAEYVIHMAGIASPKYYKKYPIETIESSVWGARNMLELARSKDTKSFLLFSSSEIYGDPDLVPTPETYKGNVSCTGPRACYDEAKRLSETLSLAYQQQYGTPIRIVRPFNVFGPGMKHDDHRVIPAWIMAGMEGRPLVVYSDGRQTRTFTYVTDALAGFLLVLLKGRVAEPYNVGNDRNEIAMLELAKRIAKLFPKASVETRMYPDDYPADEPHRRCPDLTKIRADTGYEPRVDLDEGIRRTHAWFLDNFGAPRRV